MATTQIQAAVVTPNMTGRDFKPNCRSPSTLLKVVDDRNSQTGQTVEEGEKDNRGIEIAEEGVTRLTKVR